MTGAVLDTLPLGSALLLATLLWGAGRITAAWIESRSWSGWSDRHRELLHHVDGGTVVGRDVHQALESIARDVTAIRASVERHDQDGDAR